MSDVQRSVLWIKKLQRYKRQNMPFRDEVHDYQESSVYRVLFIPRMTFTLFLLFKFEAVFVIYKELGQQI